ncbi:MAG TPA: protoporphyrinogen oxidase HemJ [Pseudolabrys sp.]
MYLWLKAFHIIAVISWMAGLLYLPRLFVYHTMAKPGSEQSETFKVMERRLLKYIMLPAMIVSWGLGIAMILQGHLLTVPWFQAKLVAVLALSAMHGLLSRGTRDFSLNRNRHTQKFFRIVNEIPTILMIAIVLLVVLKP